MKAVKSNKTSKAVKSNKTSKKTVSASASTAKLRATASNSKENAFHSAQPGIIAAIMHALIEARESGVGLRKEELLGILAEKFPTRPITGMSVTVSAQLSRLPFQRNFPIDKVRESGMKYTLYSAGKGAALPIK